MVRPGVVWFGEGIDRDVLEQSSRALDCDVFLTIGTSSVVYPAAQLVHEARSRGAYTVEMNIEATPASGGIDLSIRGTAESVLPDVSRIISL